MALKFSRYIQTEPVVRYIGGISRSPERISCGEGTNPFGFPPTVKAEEYGWTADMLNLYPHTDALTNAVLEYWKPYAPLTSENLLFSVGSMDAIHTANLLFQSPDALALGVAPQFPDYGCNARQLGYRYRTLHLDPNKRYAIEESAIHSMLCPEASLLYLDNPNNPTGQALPLAAISRIVKAAEAMDVAVIIDEAYAGYLPEEESALTLLPYCSNLLVLRTFSKGWGLAGLHAGYLAASPEIIALLKRYVNPYPLAAPVCALLLRALETPSYPAQCRARIIAIKEQLMRSLPPVLCAAETSPACPIVMLVHEDTTVDLAALLLERGVETISGSSFENAGKHCIRLHVPEERQIDRLCGILSTIE